MQLPILEAKDRIIKAVRENQVVVVVGETGSGKTTQIPPMLYRAGYANGKKIGITEPRRIAAISTAKFVANELGTRLGDVVGYQIRFDDRTAEGTKIKFMTDGILLRELQDDPDLRNYSVIMVDEAHERSQNIDFALGLLKDLLKRRNDLKVVVASATIDSEKFSRYFWDAPVVTVSGRLHPVEIVWEETLRSAHSLTGAVVQKIAAIHKEGKPGDILVFMTGEDDIGKVIADLKELNLSRLVTLPIYGTLSPEDQQKIFDSYPGCRKVVVATNIAETSITVDGVVYVVDSGLVKQMSFHPESGIQSLEVVEHSQAGCDQRAGRAGRTQPGMCYRLYSQTSYESRPKFTEPEIRRMSLANVVLTMEDIGLDEIEDFDFVDPPERAAFHEAYETLIALGAINPGGKGLTELGRTMARLPLEPRISRMVLEAQKHGCVKAVATIAAFLSMRNVFARPKGKEREADAAHASFKDERSDMLTFLSIWREYVASGFSSPWCYQNFLNGKSLGEVAKIREQLFRILVNNQIELSGDDVDASDSSVLKAVAAGLVYNLFRHKNRHMYDGMLRTIWAWIHPSSALFTLGPQWFVASEVVCTSKEFARGCSEVEVGWLPELVPHRARFGEPELIEVLSERRGARVKQPVLFDGEPVGSTERKVSLLEAHRIQDRRIGQASSLKLLELTFRKVLESGRIFDSYVADRGGTRYKSTSYSTEEATYCCRELPKDDYLYILGRGESYVLVEPVFRVFDLPRIEERVPAVVLAQSAATASKSPTSRLLDLSGLKDRWGARTK